MSLALRLPPFAERPREAPEIRPSRVANWLTEALTREPGFAARVIGDVLAATNRVSMSHSRRLDLTEQYWKAGALLWPRLEHRFIRASHPLQGDDLEAAKAALTLANELSTAYKRLLASEASRKLNFGGPRRLVALVRRAFQATSRVLANSYLAYAPVPTHTWYDAHEIYMFTRERRIHRHAVTIDQPDITLERLYTQSLLLALANPYGFLPSQLAVVLHYLEENAQLAKLTPVPPVHRMAKAVAIVPVGHDFPPFSANKGGNTEGSKLFLLTFDLAFELQEQIRALESGGGRASREVGSDPDARARHVALLKRLLRQWAIPPARQFNRLPSRAQVAMCAGLPGVWHYSRSAHHPPPNGAPPPPPMTQCQVVNHTSGGYALRQVDPSPAPVRVGDLIALRVEGRDGLQVAMVRWFRNTLSGTVLEFGCELLSDSPEAAAAAPEDAPDSHLMPVLVLPEEQHDADAPAPQLAAPAGAFALEQAVSLRRRGGSGFAVLTKLVEQGPGFDLYEFVSVT
jgi:hypothetical protein